MVTGKRDRLVTTVYMISSTGFTSFLYVHMHGLVPVQNGTVSFGTAVRLRLSLADRAGVRAAVD
jgi:hypothetical protein